MARTTVAGYLALPVHPWLDRTISVREAVLIQGLPLGYVFCGQRSNRSRRTAVPPPLAAGVARHLYELLNSPRRRRPIAHPNSLHLATRNRRVRICEAPRVYLVEPPHRGPRAGQRAGPYDRGGSAPDGGKAEGH